MAWPLSISFLDGYTSSYYSAGPSRYKDILLCKSARDIFFNIKAKTSAIEDEGKRSQLIPNLAEKYL
jgi:hypothetical protein